jgi:hypothetical protein
MGQSGAVSPTTSTGAIRYSGGKSAVSFDGNSDYITTPISKPSVPLTIEMWVKPGVSGSSINGIFDSAPGSTNVLRVINGIVEWWSENPGINLGLSAGNWYHLAFVFRQTDVNVIDYYRNGILVQSARGTSLTSFAWTTFNLGRYNNGGAYFNGIIDEVRISDTIRYTENFTPQVTPFETDQ